VGVTAGSREIPGRKPAKRDNNDDDDDDDDDDDNNNNNNLRILAKVSLRCFRFRGFQNLSATLIL
jgi:hypothetical protein